jgi:hypothetical protein
MKDSRSVCPPRNSARLRTFVAAVALILAGTLGSSWFAVLETLQNADYVHTARGTTPLGPAHLGIGAIARTQSKRGGTQIEGQVEHQQQTHLVAAHPLFADVDSESAQPAIQRLFNASIMLEDSYFGDAGALCPPAFVYPN